MTPEFGPDGYLQCEPFTRRPVADLWELNVWTAERLQGEFAEWLSPLTLGTQPSTIMTTIEEKIARCEAAVLRATPPQYSARAERPLDVVLDDIQRTAALPLEDAITLPPEAYTSEAFHQWEIDHVFTPEWQCLAHISQIPNAGDFLSLDLLGEPLIVVHGKDGAIRVLSRTCPHRGMDIMPPGFDRDGYGIAGPAEDGAPASGHTRLFLCPYHMWTFELDGRLKACPEMHLAKGFQRDEWGCVNFRSEVWNGFIFGNLDGTAEPLRASPRRDGFRLRPMESRRHEDRAAARVGLPFNWKVLVENFMESYHHLGAHAKTLQPMMPARDTWNEQERALFMRCHIPYKPAALDELNQRAHPFGFPTIATLDDSKKQECGLFLVYPNCLLSFCPTVWCGIASRRRARIACACSRRCSCPRKQRTIPIMRRCSRARRRSWSSFTSRTWKCAWPFSAACTRSARNAAA